MENPGLSVFAEAALLERPRVRPAWDEDPDVDEDDEDRADPVYTPPKDFGDRVHNPGYSRGALVPTTVGPKFQPGQEPEGTIQGEILPRERESAEGILNGEHNSSNPSSNPDVEAARQYLKAPGSDVAVRALSALLRGRKPAKDDLGTAHDYLSQQFPRVKADVTNGTVQAGSQLVKRQSNLPEVYTLTNKHGTFAYHDPEHVVRDMIAFQVTSNAAAAFTALQQQQKNQDDDSDDDTQQKTGAARMSNDLCPVCASGYLEPSYDPEFDGECLNCGSLVKAAAAKPRPALNRGLGTLNPGASAKGMGLSPEGKPADPTESQSNDDGDPNIPDEPLESANYHPLRGLENQNPGDTYQAPKGGMGGKRRPRTAAEADPLDEQLGKYGFRPHYKANDPRVYVRELPGGPEGSKLRLTEGLGGRGWVLSADSIPNLSQWSAPAPTPGNPGKRGPIRQIKNPVYDPDSPEGIKRKPPEMKPYQQPQMLPDQQNTPVGEKTILMNGHHPIEDPKLHYAIQDMAKSGRDSATYQQAALGTAYEPEALPKPGERGFGPTFSSVGNPGLIRFSPNQA